jgi:hypothetical protein
MKQMDNAMSQHVTFSKRCNGMPKNAFMLSVLYNEGVDHSGDHALLHHFLPVMTTTMKT